MNARSSSSYQSPRDSAFVVIRHLRDLGLYAVEYGRSEALARLSTGPRFETLERAIAWVEGLDRQPAYASGRQIGDHGVQNRKP